MLGTGRAAVKARTGCLTSGTTDETVFHVALVLAVTVRVQAGQEARARDILVELARLSREENGCLDWQAHRSVDDARTFFVYERYQDATALEHHRRTEHYDRLAVRGLRPLVEERSRTAYESL
jgi:quinol monooxygenase YgiN